MPVQHIHLHGGHAIKIALEHVDWDEVAADIDEHAAPGEARLIFDCDRRESKAIRGDLHRLKKSLQSIKGSQRSWSHNFRARASHGELVRFIFSQFLDGFTAVIS